MALVIADRVQETTTTTGTGTYTLAGAKDGFASLLTLISALPLPNKKITTYHPLPSDTNELS